MPRPGHQVLEELREAHHHAQEQVTLAESSDRQAQVEIEQLVTDRGAALLELARHDLPDLRRESIQSTIQEIQTELQQIADRKERSIAEKRGQVERLQSEETNQQTALSQLEERVSTLSHEVTRLQEAVQSELQQNSTFSSLSQQAVAAEAELHRDEKRVADVLAGAEEKLPNYEGSSLFQYLYQRGFETPRYTAQGWTRQVDRRIAKWIGYTRARRGYEFLKHTPGLMQVELEQRRTVFHLQMSQVEELEASCASRLGLNTVREQWTSSQVEREQQSQKLAESRQRLAQAQTGLADVSQGECPFYHAALDRYRNFLDSAQAEVLERHAHSTPGPQDDEIVSRIRYLSEQIDRWKPRIQELADTMLAARTVSDGLEFIVRRMTQSNFESGRSRFSDRLNLPQLLSRFQARAISREALWTELKEHQEFERSPAESTVIDLVNHPVAQVLAKAMVQVVGSALQQGVNRSLQRRAGLPSGTWPFEGARDGRSGPALPDVAPPVWVRTNPDRPSSTGEVNPASPSGSPGIESPTRDGEYRTVDRF